MEDIIKQGIEFVAQYHSEISLGILGLSTSIGIGVLGYTLKNAKEWETERRYNELRPIIRANYHSSLRTPHRKYFDKQRSLAT